jgi:hypothetical protein
MEERAIAFTLRVWVQETWRPQQPSMDLTLTLKIGPHLGNWLLKVRGVFSLLGTNKI